MKVDGEGRMLMANAVVSTEYLGGKPFDISPRNACFLAWNLIAHDYKCIKCRIRTAYSCTYCMQSVAMKIGKIKRRQMSCNFSQAAKSLWHCGVLLKKAKAVRVKNQTLPLVGHMYLHQALWHGPLVFVVLLIDRCYTHTHRAVASRNKFGTELSLFFPSQAMGRWDNPQWRAVTGNPLIFLSGVWMLSVITLWTSVQMLFKI